MTRTGTVLSDAEIQYEVVRIELVRARVRRGWSQRRLAQAMDTSADHVSELECGKVKPTCLTWLRWVGALDRRLDLVHV